MKPLSTVFSPELLAEAPRSVQLRDPRFAEIIENHSPCWCVVEVFASMQAAIASELARRRFGVYVPEVDEIVVKRGRKFEQRSPMFSGYIFVFMWLSDQNWQFLNNTDGVVAVVGTLTDKEIDIVRGVENQKRPVIIELPDDVEAKPVAQSRSKKKRRWKNRKSAKSKTGKAKPITEARLRAEIVTTRAWSAFDDILQLDSDGRNQTLMHALGLS